MNSLFNQFYNFIHQLSQRISEKPYWPHQHAKVIAVILVSVFMLFGVLAHRAVSAPPTFAVGTLFTVKEGMTLDEIAESLKTEGYIRSAWIMKAIVKGIFRNGNGAVAGDYSFEKRLSTFGISRRILAGDFHLDPIRVTIPEGLNKYEVADLLADYVSNFDKEKFIEIAPEGYLFPDTYFFAPNVTSETIVDVMKDNFERRIAALEDDLDKFGKPLDEVITMASIVETEARQFETRQIIADILWRRFNEEMPLQVDVSFKYVNGKTTFDLTLDDLDVDSPYNTYKYAGLPPTPIANPGLDSILATITPKDTKYYFFLTDHDGNMHYAETFDEHVANKRKYLP